MPASKKSTNPSGNAPPAKPVQSVGVEDRVLMRKPHPCGSSEWTVTRVGADIGLKCDGCGRKMMLTRDAFYRAARRILASGTADDAERWNPDASPGTLPEARP